MSQASKLTLAGTSLFAVGTILFVHFQQNAEQAVCFLCLTYITGGIKREIKWKLSKGRIIDIAGNKSYEGKQG